MKPPADPRGLDLAWLGSDAKGKVAVFLTAGEGPIPARALASALGEPHLESSFMSCQSQELATFLSASQMRRASHRLARGDSSCSIGAMFDRFSPRLACFMPQMLVVRAALAKRVGPGFSDLP